MNNDQKYHEYQKRNFLKVLLIICSIGVIVLEVLALFNKISLLWGLGLFIIMQILNKFVLK